MEEELQSEQKNLSRSLWLRQTAVTVAVVLRSPEELINENKSTSETEFLSK